MSKYMDDRWVLYSKDSVVKQNLVWFSKYCFTTFKIEDLNTFKIDIL